MGFSRSALYKPKTDWAAKDAPVIDALNEIIEQRPRWGFWKCFTRMRKDGKTWNHKKVHRVYCDMKLNLQRRTKKRLISRERQPLGIATDINVIWALDFMRDTLYDGRPFRTLNVIDEGNREALRIECGTSIPSAILLRTTNQLIEVYGMPKAIRVDNGPELISGTLLSWAEKRGIAIQHIQPGKPQQNAYIERYNRTVRHEWLGQYLFRTIEEVKDTATEWLWTYNHERPNMALGGITPAQKLRRQMEVQSSG